MKKIKRCLLVVDIQNDFCKGGTLEVPEADDIVNDINLLLPRFDVRIASQDWHKENHCSFIPNGGQWPIHCVAGTRGAELHPGLDSHLFGTIIRKGFEEEAYSAFSNTGLVGLLQELDIEQVSICGLAIDFCVKATAIDCANFGFETSVIPFVCRAVTHEGKRTALLQMEEAGVEITAYSL